MKKKILIVDDMMVSLMITENMLAGHYETFCASSGKEAIKIFREEQPDMVLSDLRMPGMTGYELQLALQEEYHETIPFMFMTADTNEETESKGFDNGAMDFIRKPFRPDVLLRRVANIMQTVEQIRGLKKSLTTDALTGLFNKASSERELKKICENSFGALLMIDLDSFKHVNDIFGHAMGDKVLVSFADILRAAMRPSDLIGRMGGDEFIAFCHGVGDEHAIEHKADYINERIVEIAKKLMGDDMNIPLGASIGCVFVPAGGTDFTELYKMADKALYVVKQNGKHGYNIFTPADHEEEKDSAEVNLAQIETILAERNADEGGAFLLSFDSFRTIYRFLKRTRDSYINMNCLLVFSVTRHKEGRVPIDTAVEQFIYIARTSLRKGDVIAQNGSNQILVVLTNTDAGHDINQVIQGIIGRIHDKWLKTMESRFFTFQYDWKNLDSL